MTLLLLTLGAAFAHSAGMSGNSVTGCGCHSASPGASVGATFSASSTTVAPGDTITVSLLVSSTAAARNYAGLDVSATGGTLGAGSNTTTMGGDVTHSAAVAMAAGSVTFDFTWTAPTTEGSYSFRGVGLAANRDGGDGGDAWNSASSLSILVDDGCDDEDGDGYEWCEDGSGADCDDADAAVSPSATETCNGVDDDCDGTVDEASAADAGTWYRDGDGDGWGSAATFTVSCDAPAGYVGDATDCDDTDATRSPGATELCNLVDDDCDGVVDPGSSADAPTWYADADADGYGGTTAVTACSQPTGYLGSSTDCDDTRPAVNPGATETCDGVDQDCDGAADDGATDQRTFYADADGDGYGVAGTATLACSAAVGFVAYAGDCDDGDAAWHPGAAESCASTEDLNCDGAAGTGDADGDGYAACEECDDGDAAVHPGATDTCNGRDDDCDGTIDPDSAPDAASWYTDADGDGHGDPLGLQVACLAPAGAVASDDDCDDTDPAAYAGAPETCDGVDDDCDGAVDNDAVGAAVWYADGDGDGYGDPLGGLASCTEPTGYVTDAADCDDTDAAVSPAGVETCDGVDDDCDGLADEPDAVDATAWYADVDGDGVGDPTVATVACGAPEGFVAQPLDCDDGDAAVNPGAAEVWYDGVDQDCDGNDADADHDGWLAPTDCADDDPAVNPAAADVPYDGVDADCSGNSDYDADGDGYDSESYGGTDCDDADPTTFVGAPDLGDGVEHDCDVRNDHDRDDDGYDDVASGGNDCDDADSTVNPGADETWYDGVDQDCDGADDFDQDGDGAELAADCDDRDAGRAADCSDAGGDSGLGDTGGASGEGCGCAATGAPGAWAAAVLAGAVALRRRRR